MRKLVLTAVVAGAALFGAMGTQQAQAQTYPNVADLTPFTQPANFMSLPGLLRLRYLQQSGRWISREEAVNAARSQGANVGPAPTGQ
jgi:hypothetical protein